MVKKHSNIDDPQAWITKIGEERHSQDVVILKNALTLLNDSSKPALNKGLSIANILYSLGLDSEALAAGLIYPALQAKEIHLDTVTDHLGVTVSKLLRDVLQLQSLRDLHDVRLHTHHQIENLRKMLLAMVTDVRAVLLVLAERLWQLHEAKKLAPPEQIKIGQETLDIFAPLANRLGIWQLKWEIEDLCLRYLKPEVYNGIAKWLASRRQEREDYIQQMLEVVSKLLNDANVADFKLSGRVKHIYSIYKKMQRKNVSIDEIYDISAIRILVPEIPDCYNVLGILQNTWQQVLHEFDDYISQPKANGYRSIHTVVVGPENKYIEIQIRTYQMHQESELGVAAHWQYKEGVLQPSSYDAKIALLRQLMAWQKEIVGSQSTKEQPLQDLFTDTVYVFTPLGDIIDLPKGATPLDFAYYIHSEVGHRCRGAKINGNIVQLTYQLQTGDRVEILTAKQANPSRDWLNPHLGYLKTARARAKAQHWFRMKDEAQNISAGREMLEKDLKKLGIHEKIDLGLIANKLHYKSTDELYIALAIGEVRNSQIINIIRPPHVAPVAILPTREADKGAASQIQILGINNLLTQIALCCKPLPGDAIIGYVTRTRGVSIHRRDCKNITNVNSDHRSRLIEVNWGQKTAGKFPVDLVLRVFDRAGLLRDITTLLANEKINLLGVQTQKSQVGQEIDIFLTIEIDNRSDLNKFMEMLKQIASVSDVRRR